MYICTYIYHKHQQKFMLVHSQTTYGLLWGSQGSGSFTGVVKPGYHPVENPHGFRHLAEVGFGLLYLWPQQHPFDVT